jgi:hypothetical protein
MPWKKSMSMVIEVVTITKEKKEKKYYMLVKSNINGPNSRKLVHRLLTRTLRVWIFNGSR